MAIQSPEAKARKAEYMKAWRKANREQLREYNRSWLAENRDANAQKAAERNATYYKRSKDEILARKRERYAAMGEKERLAYSGYTPERIEHRRAMGREWVRKNPGKAAAQVAKRRAQLLQATPTWADLAAIRRVYEMASDLEAFSLVEIHVDHVIPLRGETVCGLHVHDNLRVCTADLNRKKSNRHAA